MTKEVFNDVPNYEGYYQVSNLGNVKSLGRDVMCSGGYTKFNKGRVLKKIFCKHYYYVILCKLGKPSTRTIHSLVAEAFLNHKPNGHELVVNHINHDKIDNRVENLEIVTQRVNSQHRDRVGKNKYLGSYWCKSLKKWGSSIYLNKVAIHLGYFETQINAHKIYNLAFKNMEMYDGDRKKFRNKIKELNNN